MKINILIQQTKIKDNAIKDKVLRDIRALFELDEDDYYKPIRNVNVFSSNYTEYESSGDKDKSLSVKEYLNIIRPYSSDMINDLKTQDELKVELMMAINFMSPKDSKDSNETCTMYTKSNNIEIMIGTETDKIIKELFDSLLHKDIKKY